VPTINLVEDLNKAYPNLVIVLLTNEETPYFVHLSKLAGARGYILKSQIGLANSFSETLLSILTEGKRIFPETFAPTQIAEISAAELRVVVTKCEHPGKSSTVIGEMLGLEDSTVRNHLSSVYKKLGVKGLVEAKLRLMESNLISE
jgi:DNA-binding NarL/FixJ family response regulator